MTRDARWNQLGLKKHAVWQLTTCCLYACCEYLALRSNGRLCQTERRSGSAWRTRRCSRLFKWGSIVRRQTDSTVTVFKTKMLPSRRKTLLAGRVSHAADTAPAQARAHAACLSPTLNSLIIHPRVNVLNALYSLRSLDQSINPTLTIQGRDLTGSTNERPV